jgi:hypothetical protein
MQLNYLFAFNLSQKQDMRLLIILSLILSNNALQAQDLQLDWAEAIGGNNAQLRGVSSCSDYNGNIYTTGQFNGIAEFDNGIGSTTLSSLGVSSTFFAKYDANGNLIWARLILGQSLQPVNPTKIRSNASGEVFLSGVFYDPTDFDPGSGTAILTPSSINGVDGFIAKYDANGNYLWAKNITGFGVTRMNDFQIDSQDNVVCAGTFEVNTDLDPGPGSVLVNANGFTDAFLVKLDPNGNFIWGKNFGDTGYDNIRGVDIGVSDEVYITGSFESTVDFSTNGTPQTLTAVSSDVFIAKYTNAGDLIWVQQQTGSADDLGKDIVVDNNGAAYVCGSYQGTYNPDPSSTNLITTSLGAEDIFLCKYTTNGSLVWANQFGGNGTEIVEELFLDNNQQLFVIGEFQNTVDFDPGANTTSYSALGTLDIFLSKFDASGSFEWSEHFGGLGYDFGFSVFKNVSGKLFAQGFFRDNLDIEPGAGITNLITSNFLDDMFIISFCESSESTETTVACNNYFWNGTDYTVSGNYQTTLQNAAGCDSLVNLNLTIEPLDTTISVAGTTITANSTAGSSFQWIDCQTNSFIPGATSAVFTPTQNGSYAVIIGNGNCADTSSCALISTVSFDEQELEKLEVFPNPSAGNVTLTAGSPIGMIRIIAPDGRVVYQTNGQESKEIQMNISGLSRGTYIVKVETSTRVNSIKLWLTD